MFPPPHHLATKTYQTTYNTRTTPPEAQKPLQNNASSHAHKDDGGSTLPLPPSLCACANITQNKRSEDCKLVSNTNPRVFENVERRFQTRRTPHSTLQQSHATQIPPLESAQRALSNGGIRVAQYPFFTIHDTDTDTPTNNINNSATNKTHATPIPPSESAYRACLNDGIGVGQYCHHRTYDTDTTHRDTSPINDTDNSLNTDSCPTPISLLESAQRGRSNGGIVVAQIQFYKKLVNGKENRENLREQRNLAMTLVSSQRTSLTINKNSKTYYTSFESSSRVLHENPHHKSQKTLLLLTYWRSFLLNSSIIFTESHTNSKSRTSASDSQSRSTTQTRVDLVNYDEDIVMSEEEKKRKRQERERTEQNKKKEGKHKLLASQSFQREQHSQQSEQHLTSNKTVQMPIHSLLS